MSSASLSFFPVDDVVIFISFSMDIRHFTRFLNKVLLLCLMSYNCAHAEFCHLCLKYVYKTLSTKYRKINKETLADRRLRFTLQEMSVKWSCRLPRIMWRHSVRRCWLNPLLCCVCFVCRVQRLQLCCVLQICPCWYWRQRRHLSGTDRSLVVLLQQCHQSGYLQSHER